MTIHHALLVAAAVAANVLTGAAHAQECVFPDAVPIPEGQTAFDVLRDELPKLCPALAAYKPWAGLPVADASGATIGFTGDLLIGKNEHAMGQIIFLEVLGQQENKFAVALPELNLSERWSDKYFAVGKSDSVASYVNDSAIIYGGKAMTVTPLSQFGTDGIVSLIVSAGANPYPERMIVHFESIPPNAMVTVGNSRVGPTETQAWVAKGALPQIVLTLDGYVPCTYADGTFSEPTFSVDAKFHCDLAQ